MAIEPRHSSSLEDLDDVERSLRDADYHNKSHISDVRHDRSTSQIAFEEFKQGLEVLAGDEGILSEEEIAQYVSNFRHFQNVTTRAKRSATHWRRIALVATVSSILICITIFGLVIAGIEYMKDVRPEQNNGKSVLKTTHSADVVFTEQATASANHINALLWSDPAQLQDLQHICLPCGTTLECFDIGHMSISTGEGPAERIFYSTEEGIYFKCMDKQICELHTKEPNGSDKVCLVPGEDFHAISDDDIDPLVTYGLTNDGQREKQSNTGADEIYLTVPAYDQNVCSVLFGQVDSGAGCDSICSFPDTPGCPWIVNDPDRVDIVWSSSTNAPGP